MENRCSKCGKELPEEAHFCLHCFTNIDSQANTSDVDAEMVVPKHGKPSKKFAFTENYFVGIKKKFNKKFIRHISIAMVFLFIMGISVYCMRSFNSDSTPMQEAGTTVIKVTETVPLTDTFGVNVTTANGDQVFETVEVTKTVQVTESSKKTPLQNFFAPIFDKNDVSDTTETSKQSSFFDFIFGESTTKAPVSNENPVDSTTDKTDVSKGEAPSSDKTGDIDSTVPPTVSSTVSSAVTSTLEGSENTATSSASNSNSEQTTSNANENNASLFEYRLNSKSNAILTNYTGSASIVTIPSYIDNHPVAEIDKNCFSNKGEITEIRFDNQKSSLIIFNHHCFNNLTSLKKIVTSNKSIHLSSEFAYNCPIVYIGPDGSSNNELIDGAYYRDNKFFWFTASPEYTTLTFPSWCTSIDNGHNLDEVSNLKVINIHKNLKNIPTSPMHWGTGLKAINVEAGHPSVFSQDGVLFYKWTSTSTHYDLIYPPQKTDTVFKLPKNCILSCGKNGTSGTVNTSLRELYLPASSKLAVPDSTLYFNNCYPNLKTIHIPENHPQLATIKNTFTGNLIIENV